jgi:hypothetical protein
MNNLWQATIKVGRPGQSKADDELSEHLIEHCRAGKKSLKAVKMLWGNSMDELASCDRKARKIHKEMTFEGIGGIRVAVEAERQLWLDRMSRLSEEYNTLSAKWLDNYDIYIEQERLDKNGAFRLEDYPSREALASRFRFQYAILPMPEPNQFIRNALTDELGRRLAEEYQQRLQNTTAQITRQVLNTLLGLINDTAESLANDGSIIDSENKKGPFAKLREYIDRIPALNITNDPTISRIAAEARERLDFTTEELRKSQTTRQLAAAHAQGIALQFGQVTRKIAKAA